MTAQEFSTYIKEGLGLYKTYKEIEMMGKEPGISELDIARALEAERARLAAEAVAKKPNWLLYGAIGVGVLALIIYVAKR